MNKLGLYFHVPFCLSKCPYCDFYSLVFDNAAAEEYTGALCRSLLYYRGASGLRAVDTVYFGGGTPSLLGTGRLCRILEAAAASFSFSDPEVTLEANPGTVSADTLKDLRAAGFNRVSFGAQSFTDSELIALGRAHNAAQARACIEMAAAAGFENISADLMLGIPLQTAESLGRSVGCICSLPLSHVSAYMLKIEEGTPFSRENMAALRPGEDATAELYLDCVERLEARGFQQYEISNFAKGGAVSRHNMKYWLCREYLGLGPSAHSYICGERFHIPDSLAAFCAADNPMSLAVSDGGGGDFEEYAMLRLRLKEGLDAREALTIYGPEAAGLEDKAHLLEKNGLLTLKNGVISLTAKGFLLSNSVIAQLLYAKE